MARQQGSRNSRLRPDKKRGALAAVPSDVCKFDWIGAELVLSGAF
jgi:hypothetical protein